MSTIPFPACLASASCILGEGAIIERLRRNPSIDLDPYLVNASFIYDDIQRHALASIYRQYLEIGRDSGLPLLMTSSTWRASRERIDAAGLAGRDVNGDNVRFLKSLRDEEFPFESQVFIGGLMSCRGDAYSAGEALSLSAARDFHGWQADRLAASGVDVLLAATLPAMSEAAGLALALAATGTPYLISFVARPSGTLLDGTPLKDAIACIETMASPRPLAYLINCTHATFARAALLHPLNSSPLVRERVVGLLANTAALSPEELDSSSALVEENPEVFGATVASLQRELGLKIVGGCCGTDDRHIRALATQLIDKPCSLE